MPNAVNPNVSRGAGKQSISQAGGNVAFMELFPKRAQISEWMEIIN